MAGEGGAGPGIFVGTFKSLWKDRGKQSVATPEQNQVWLEAFARTLVGQAWLAGHGYDPLRPVTRSGPPPPPPPASYPTAAGPGQPPPAWETPPSFDWWKLLGIGSAQAGVIPGPWPGSKPKPKRRRKRGRKESLKDYAQGGRFAAGFGIVGEVVGEALGIPSETAAKAEKAAEEARDAADKAEKRLRDREEKNTAAAAVESAKRAAQAEADEWERLQRGDLLERGRDARIKKAGKAETAAVKEAIKAARPAAEWELAGATGPAMPPVGPGILGMLPPGAFTKYGLPILIGSGLKMLTGTSQRIGDVVPSAIDIAAPGESYQYGQSYLTAPNPQAVASLQPKTCVCRTASGKRKKKRKGKGKRICYNRA